MPKVSSLCAMMCLAFLLTGCDAILEGQLSEEQANRVLASLDKAGVQAHKEKEEGFGGERSYQVRVPRSSMSTALAAMRVDALPQQQEPGIRDLFQGKTLVSTATEERVRYASALAGELSRSIETIDGVLDARVHVALPPAVALDAGETRPQASVLITLRGGGVSFSDADVQRLVAGAVHGLLPQSVSIVRLYAKRASSVRKPMAYVGPIAVSPSSAHLLKWVLGVSLLLNLVLMAVTVWLVQRRGAGGLTTGSGDQA